MRQYEVVENSGIEITCCMILFGCLNLTETLQLLVYEVAFSYQLYRLLSTSNAVVFSVAGLVHWG